METVQPESIGLISDRLARIQPVMQGYIDRKEFAGVITAISRRGQTAHLAKVGWQEIKTGHPMSFDAIFRIYSMSKPITSAAVMMLCEEGKVRLGDPVSRYIPGFKNSRVMVPRNGCDYDLVPAQREMTVHDLFTHSSGLSYGFDQQSALDDLYRKELYQRFEKNSNLTLEDFVTHLTRLPLAFHPGTAFRYSFSIDVLGYIIQLASGMPFEDFLQERIFAPLGMIDTAFWVPPEKAARLAEIYGPAEEGGLKPLDAPLTSRYLKTPKQPVWWGWSGFDRLRLFALRPDAA